MTDKNTPIDPTATDSPAETTAPPAAAPAAPVAPAVGLTREDVTEIVRTALAEMRKELGTFAEHVGGDVRRCQHATMRLAEHISNDGSPIREEIGLLLNGH